VCGWGGEGGWLRKARQHPNPQVRYATKAFLHAALGVSCSAAAVCLTELNWALQCQDHRGILPTLLSLLCPPCVHAS